MTPEESIARNVGNEFIRCSNDCDRYDPDCPFCRALVKILAAEVRVAVLDERKACAETCRRKAQRSGNNLLTTTCLFDAAQEIVERPGP